MYLTQTLHRSARQTPDTPATIFGNRVAILSLNSDRYHEYLLAVPWAGGVVTRMNIRWNPAEIAYAFGDSGSTVLLVDDAFAPMLPALRGVCPGLTTVIHCGDGHTPDGTLPYEDLVASHDPVPDVHRSGNDLAGIVSTGGTTAHPKGVMLSHANLLVSARPAAGSSWRTGGSCTRRRCSTWPRSRPGWAGGWWAAPTSSSRCSPRLPWRKRSSGTPSPRYSWYPQ